MNDLHATLKAKVTAHLELAQRGRQNSTGYSSHGPLQPVLWPCDEIRRVAAVYGVDLSAEVDG